ncbi:MAG TPA: UPF0182 family protein [Actinomycetales bacterium]|nr:UPF0182 family protein [Actinomycetales bacterium]
MTQQSSDRPAGHPTSRNRRRGALIPTLVVLAVLAIAVVILAQFWTEWLWFDQIGFIQVLRTRWIVKALLFVIGGLVMGAAIWGSIYLAWRNRPIYAPSTPQQVVLDRYRASLEPLRKLVMIAGPIVIGLFAGASLSSQWETVLLWLNGQPFNQTDPQFGMDISFFVFQLPWWKYVVGFLMAVVILALIVGAATHYLYGGIRIGGSGDPMTRTARLHLAILAAVFTLLIGANYWLDRYTLMSDTSGKFDGASYSDIHAVLPSKGILAGISIFVALLFIAAAFRSDWKLPALGVGLMVLSGIVVGAAYPALIQRFQVEPNAQQLEKEFIQRNIDATLFAYGMDDIEITRYEAKTDAEAGALRKDAEATASIRLLDPTIVSPSFRQLQQNKQYYNFPDTLAVDRYTVGDEKRDTVIAVRELDLNGLPASDRTWVNERTVYTHGYGVVAAFGNTTQGDGRPSFYQRGIPSTGELGDYEPRIYFGQRSPSYSIVGAPEGTTPWELDYPDDEAATGQVNNTFSGDGGPSIGSFWNKLLFAIKFGDEKILFSDRVNSESQILFDRDPATRVEKVAPWLTLDGRVYPAIVDERVVWIVDGYTTTDKYPYSESMSLESATRDAITETTTTIQALAPQRANYVKNSVKATVDAQNGEVTLYAWQPDDPILKTWEAVYPGSVKPIADISSELMSHIRYPEDLFKVQRQLLTRYHVSDAEAFYSGQDFWLQPTEPTQGENSRILQPPYYLTLQMPGQESPEFSLTSSFITGGERNVLTGFLAADAEAGDEAGKPREGYGKLRLLELPRDLTVPGPGQVQNNFDANSRVSETLNLLNRGNSTVLKGNLLTLPVGGGLLYVQPVYVQSSQGTKFPLLQKVLVAFGENVGFADTLDEALDQIFGGDSGVNADGNGQAPDGDVDIPDDIDEPDAPEPDTEEPDGGEEPEIPEAVGDAHEQLAVALQKAREAMAESQEALTAGDFAAYGAAQDKLQEALEDAFAAEAEIEKAAN